MEITANTTITVNSAATGAFQYTATVREALIDAGRYARAEDPVVELAVAKGVIDEPACTCDDEDDTCDYCAGDDPWAGDVVDALIPTLTVKDLAQVLDAQVVIN